MPLCSKTWTFLLLALGLAAPAVAQTGTITANPPGCHPALGSSTCEITLSWTSQNAPDAVVRVVFESGAFGGYVNHAPNKPAGVTIPWISATPRRFVLFEDDGPSATELASTPFITARPAQIRASCNGCLLGGAGSCSIDLAWEAPFAPPGSTVRTVIESTGAFGAWSHSSTSHAGLTIPWITLQQRRFVILAGPGTTGAPVLADSGIVQAVSSGLQTAVCRGGSNFQWFDLDVDPNEPNPALRCDRGPYGVLKAFAANQAAIRSALMDMHSNGQRVLRLGIHYSVNTANSGNATVPVDSAGRLGAGDLQNLEDLLEMVKDEDFEEIILTFFGHGKSDPNDSAVQLSCAGGPAGCVTVATLVDRAKNLIAQVRPVVRASGLAYRLDLRNEGMPVVSNAEATAYAHDLWSWYSATYGKLDTVGFSIVGDNAVNIANRVSNMGNVYGTDLPLVHQWHFYNRCVPDEGGLLTAAHDAMSQAGIPGPFIIGETYFQDALGAESLRTAIQATGREVLYLLQWPQLRPTYVGNVRKASCELFCPQVSVGSTVPFDEYTSRGF